MQPNSQQAGDEQQDPTQDDQTAKVNPAPASTPGVSSTDDFEHVDFNKHHARVIEELRQLGASWYGQTMMEARYLPRIIHPNEHLEGVVYGWQEAGIVMLAATDRRIIFLDRKPFYTRDEEISYISVRGVSHAYRVFVITVTLHTQVDDFMINTFNHRCAQTFMKAIQRHSLEYNQL